ncbi:MAG: hypothetical protein A2381_10025 [Bdellovibrionales bacterium RIFOXYB1_FULL_37_110]|nr:MAG: hypothetical protein A2181_03105 [Bdellovibrionales bacterium RIFOXYA1_FULL_38_20]OFZ48929.1 MAG: hypothetical protein A2417_08485 [Bdellovibrionales bacterium RIFOXYC1_FULL_37_79]OFZ59606.1 MAG: hypothetical protein A2381_10025 [Bdellovibrionales bacterium RIFOXYB1_FULL_37_110]OFZ62415.1 MAG: hypothetical protein A2577_03230 [Bdellovibrionales bacterium RIFOXYD1_FULL_36_51]
MSLHQHDIIIIGSGIAGLTAALKLVEANLSVAVYSREEDLAVTNTMFAQGGIIYPTEDDKELCEDIVRASSYTSNVEAANVLSNYGGNIFDEVLIAKAKADFDKLPDGTLAKTLEAAHSKERIVHTKDYTGKEIEQSLLAYLLDKNRFPNLHFYRGHTAIDLLTPSHRGVLLRQRYEEERVVGAYFLNQKTGSVIKSMAPVTILATGGYSSIYLHHSNTEHTRGDGQAMAKRAGVNLINMEFVQFHPTTFFDGSLGRRFLISEAVRGEGGILKNFYGERFMHIYHQDGELAPRDVVARAILQETINTKTDYVYLDISFKDKDWLIKRFPTIYNSCLEKGVDISQAPIPVVPAAHYTCGGIKTNLYGKTSLNGLFAVGEVACTGLHGANRLASTSLLEGLTMGYLAAEKISASFKDYSYYNPDEIKNWEILGTSIADKSLIQQDWMTLKQTTWNYLGLTRSINRIKRGQAILHELNNEIHTFYKHNKLTDELIGLRNAVETGLAVLLASKQNKQSIGCFYCEDY